MTHWQWSNPPTSNAAAEAHDLFPLVAALELDPGWSARMEHGDRRGGTKALTLVIEVLAFDTYHPERGRTYRATHFFPVPYSRDREEPSWRRWLLGRYLDVLAHEGCETFRLGGERPFVPGHGPGVDPYVVPAGP